MNTDTPELLAPPPPVGMPRALRIVNCDPGREDFVFADYAALAATADADPRLRALTACLAVDREYQCRRADVPLTVIFTKVRGTELFLSMNTWADLCGELANVPITTLPRRPRVLHPPVRADKGALRHE